MEALASPSMSPSAVPPVSGRRPRPRYWRGIGGFPIQSMGVPPPSSSSSSSSMFVLKSTSTHISQWGSARGSALCRASCGDAAPGDEEEEDGDDEVLGTEEEEEEKGGDDLLVDGNIPASPQELVKRVSSRAYDMRRQLKQAIDSIGYDVLESNPWREYPKSVYVLTQRENQLCTMKTRRSRSEVERELGLLFSRHKSDMGKRSKQANTGTKFRMLVEDIREGILVFEDEHDAERYCDLLQGGQGCEGIAEVDASSVFDICHKMRALAVLFRRGRELPLPETLELNLKARNRSLEDQ